MKGGSFASCTGPFGCPQGWFFAWLTLYFWWLATGAGEGAFLAMPKPFTAAMGVNA